MSPLERISYIADSIHKAAKKADGIRALSYVDIIWCGIRYGASPNNYVNFDLKNARSAERKTFLTHRKSQYLMKRFNNPKFIWQVENKYEFAKLIGKKYGRRFANSKTLTKEDLLTISNKGRIIYKPLEGGQGVGIKVFETGSSSNSDELLSILHDLPDGIVEEWIVQDERMSSLYPDAVNPIRIQTLRTDDVHIIAATITIANGTSIANASGVKAIFALVDIDNGTVVTDGYDYNGNLYITHPTTGVVIKGFKIPQWDKVLSLIIQSAKKVKNIRYIGWDIAISKDGPIIIEANNDPGYTAYQLPVLTGSHKGIWSIYRKYIN